MRRVGRKVIRVNKFDIVTPRNNSEKKEQKNEKTKKCKKPIRELSWKAPFLSGGFFRKGH